MLPLTISPPAAAAAAAAGRVPVVAQVLGGARQLARWPGRTTLPVYAAWNLSAWLTLRVISLMRTGARRLKRSFLWCTQRKSTLSMSLSESWTRVRAGTPDMKAMGRPEREERTPRWKAFSTRGGVRAQVTK